MKVVLFGNSTWCIYNFRRNLIRELVRDGHKVAVLAPFDPTFSNAAYVRRLKKLGTEFYAVPLRPRNLNPFLELWAIVRLLHILFALRPQIVLTFTVKCNLYAALCRKLLSFTQIANIPGLGEAFEKHSLVQRIVCFLYRYSFAGVQTALFQNREDLVHCVKTGLVPEASCRLIPGSGVDLERFPVMPPPCSSERRVFLMFGRLLPQKGYYCFLQAAEMVRARLGKNVEFWILGIEDRNRSESGEVLSAIKEAESRGHVRYLPQAVDVVPVLEQADVVVLPSWYNEGVPRSLLEAMACAKPIITTDWKGCRETVKPGRNGCLVPIKDAKSLAQAMMKVAGLEPHALRAMGLQSRALVEESYDERLVISRYLSEIYGREVVLDVASSVELQATAAG